MDDERIIAYFLKELTAEEQERFEDEWWASDEWPEQVEVVEYELIDDYLRNQLTPERHRLFERNYLVTKARRERMEMSAALLYVLNEQAAAGKPSPLPEPTPSWGDKWRAFWRKRQIVDLPPVWALLCVAVVVGALWFYYHNRAPQSFTELTLASANYTLGAGDKQPGLVTLPLATDALRVRLELPEEARGADGYGVRLVDTNRRETPLPVTLKDAQHITVVITKAQLPHGLYALHLFTAKDGGTPQRITGSYRFMAQ